MAKHMTLSQRIDIEKHLDENKSFRKISRDINMSHTTVSREIETRRVLIKGSFFNTSFKECEKLSKPPFVCNGCPNRKKCKLNKYFYYAKDANDDYRTILVDSRIGIDIEQKEFREMDKIILEETSNGHSFYMILQDHPEFDLTEKTLYNYQEKGYLSCKSIDMPRKVRYKKRKRTVSKTKSQRKEQTCTVGRTYDLFVENIINKGINFYTEMDTVEGEKGHSCLLTLCILPFNFLIAYKIESQSISEITDKINIIKNKIGFLSFHQIFTNILTDNGKEFKRPDLIEDNGPDIQKSHIYYCEAKRSDQKATIEVTHEYIRRYVEQGESFDNLTQDDIDLMINHINSVKRKILYGKTPYELLEGKIGNETLKKLGYYRISPNDIVINSSIFKR